MGAAKADGWGANDSATGAFVVIRQDDPSDTKSKDAIVATRCDVLMIVCGDNQVQVSGAMGKVCTAFENVDTEVNGVGLRIRCESPGKVENEMVELDVVQIGLN